MSKDFVLGSNHALREGFGSGLLLAGKKNTNVWALSADLTESNKMDAFKEKFPRRFVELGVAEQNLIGVGAGLARIGKIPFTASFAVFSPGRSLDQIRTSVCYSNNNVKIYGGHAGITVGEDGATHQALEDIALMRTLPNMTVLVPCDAAQMHQATLAAAKHKGPVYLRGGRPKIPVITQQNEKFIIGKAQVMHKGSDVTIISCGLMTARALVAAHVLEKEGITCEVIDNPSIKPFDEKTLLTSTRKTGCVVSCEEHQINAGLGSAVAEVLAENHPVPLERVGVHDTFGESGNWEELCEKYGLTASDIRKAVHKVLKRKRQ